MGRVSGNHLGKANGFSQVNGEHILFASHLCQSSWVEGEFSKGTVSLASPPTSETVAQNPSLSALAMKLVNLVSPRMSLAIFELLPLCWSPEQLSL